MANQKIRIKLKSYDHSLVDLACTKIVEAAEKMGSKVSGPIPLPTEREIVTVLRATHKYKDAREQFELRTYKRLIDIYSPNAKTIDSLSKLDLPAGIDIKIGQKVRNDSSIPRRRHHGARNRYSSGSLRGYAS